MSLFMFDSPQYYHDKRDYEKSKKSFKEIALWNGITDFDHEFQFHSELNVKERKNRNYLTLIIKADDSEEGIELEDTNKGSEDRPLFNKEKKVKYSVIKE